jgi:hypothetical protein
MPQVIQEKDTFQALPKSYRRIEILVDLLAPYCYPQFVGFGTTAACKSPKRLDV